METSNVFQDLLNQTSFNNTNVMQHLTTLVGYLTSPKYAQDSLTEASTKVKLIHNSKPAHKNAQPQNALKEVPYAMSNRKKQLDFKIPAMPSLLYRNFTVDSELFREAGVYFGAETTLHIQKAVVKLASRNDVVSVRFWGRVSCKEKDYYIIQGVSKPSATNSYEDPVPKGSEKVGEGVNQLTFWATNDIFADWHELPHVTRQQILVSRKNKRMLVGNLDAYVEGYPAFQGKQKHYLKCQLVRITHACEIAPKGLYKANDENPKVIEFEQEQKMPEFAELSTLESWNHIRPAVLGLGRCSHWLDPDTPEQQKETAAAELTEKDPQIQMLKAIAEDKAIPQKLGQENPWYTKIYGDTQVFKKDEQVSLVYGVVGLKNLHWPGWLTVANKSGYSHIYVGNLTKSTQESQNPMENADLMVEAEDITEHDEPNPKQLPPPPAEDKPEDQADPEQ